MSGRRWWAQKCRHDMVAPVVLSVTGEHVANVCEGCLESLPVWFGCCYCVTEYTVALGGYLRPVLVAACRAHEGAAR